MILLPDSENRTIVASLISTKHRNVTDKRTDGETDTAMANTTVALALQAMRTRCKNESYITFIICYGASSRKLKRMKLRSGAV